MICYMARSFGVMWVEHQTEIKRYLYNITTILTVIMMMIIIIIIIIILILNNNNNNYYYKTRFTISFDQKEEHLDLVRKNKFN